MSELPEGWTEALLTDVARQKKFSIVDGPFGSDLKLSDYAEDGTVPVLTTKNLTGSYDPASVRFISREKYDLLKRSRVVGGDILIAKIGSIGRCSIYPGGAPTAIIPANLCKITVDERVIYNRFLYWQIRSEGFQEELRDITSATAQPAFSVQRLKTLLIALAPFGEQHRIVLKLEELLGKVEACQERLARIPRLLKRFRQSVLAAACSGRLTTDWRDSNEAPIWEEKTLGELILEKPKNGYSAKPVKYRTPFRVLTLTATTSGEFKPEHFKYFDGPIGADSGLWLQPDDILVQRGNTIEYVGVPAIYNGHPNEFIYPDLMMRLRARAHVDPKFLYFALSWQRSRNYLRKKATGTAGSMPKINQQTLISVPIDLPPLDEQREIVRCVEALFKFADQIEARHQRAKAQVDKLTQSILAKAFRGELVPTEAELARREGREYESASVLLDRIRKEHGELGVNPKTTQLAVRRARPRSK